MNSDRVQDDVVSTLSSSTLQEGASRFRVGGADLMTTAEDTHWGEEKFGDAALLRR